MENRDYYLGLDIGTDSIGYAVTDEKYNLIKFHGEPAWGTHIFEQASLNEEKRKFRTARRRLDRRQQRVELVQELFAKEIGKVDEKFYKRIHESNLYKKDGEHQVGIFVGEDYNDTLYYDEYPSIHHLIAELMNNPKPHDVRLVYIACAWLVAHRGHFLSNMNKDNLSEIKDFESVYAGLKSFFSDNGYVAPWGEVNVDKLGEVLKKKQGVTAKYRELIKLLLNDEKPAKDIREDFPFSQEGIIKLLAGATYKLSDLFANEEYKESGSVNLGMDDDKLGEIMATIGDDYDLIAALRSVSDWAVLVDALGDSSTISEAKVCVYEQHKKDLMTLKYILRKYDSKDAYFKMFRDVASKNNYVAYSQHESDGKAPMEKSADVVDFSKYVMSVIDKFEVDDSDRLVYEDMKERLALNTFLPKQVNTDNRVIPHQLYWYELRSILKNAAAYIPGLSEKDEDGLSVADKIESVFLFRIPYFVGPLNDRSKYAWLKRKEGKIYPWNFEQMVDLDGSEQEFICRMTNTCTYLPGQNVLPKDSLCYHKFMVLNEINNLRINGERISVKLKQRIYDDLFMKYKKVTRKKLEGYLISINELKKGEESALTGIDIEIKANLAPQIAFKRLMDEKVLSESDVESIIERSAYAEDKKRLLHWLKEQFPHLNEDDQQYICKLKLKDFGRLSKMFLCELEGIDKCTGNPTSILAALQNDQLNLMELIFSEKYSFGEVIRDFRQDYYATHKFTLEERMDEMYLSNAVKRPVYRTLDIVKDINKAFGEPKKIFVEMTRGASPEQKGKRTKSRKEQILDFYGKCKDEDVKILKKQLEEMGEYADNKLQGDKLFLYYMQLGKCMYTGTPIVLEQLASEKYNIDHIYPQALVKDDSIINNRVLVLSEVNGSKKDVYPIDKDIREKMHGFWKGLKNNGLISEEKYKRLTRNTGFTEDEKWGFINRQLTETSQATKAVATLLGELFPNAEIVYAKARLTSDFRQEFDILKSRAYNDLHHAVDAYLNIVCGNVYNMRFTKQWFNINSEYSIKTQTIFKHPVVCGGKTVWSGEDMLKKVICTARKNTAHFTRFSFIRGGGFFDQMPVKASDGLIPLKKGMSTEQYGGYNKASIAFLIPVRYKVGKKSDIIVMSVEHLYARRFLNDEKGATEYAFDRLQRILGKKVDEVSFPMGMRPWKINTMLSLDGFQISIPGIGSGGKCLVAQPSMQFSSDPKWQTYLKRIERLIEKVGKNKAYIISEEYDKVNKADNEEMYRMYIEKYKHTVYSKRVNCPLETLENGLERFVSLDVFSQVETLFNIHQTFGRVSGGCDLEKIGGKKKSAATVSFSSTISNWSKYYNDVRIIDESPSGLWKKVSANLLELL